jgi:hypothetical protein
METYIDSVVRRGLAWHTTDETLREGFQHFGKVDEAVLPLSGSLHVRLLMFSRSSSKTEIPTEAADSGLCDSKPRKKPTWRSRR